MKRQNSTYILKSTENLTSEQNCDFQHPVVTTAEGPLNWNSNWNFPGYDDKTSYFTTEIQSYEPPMFYSYPDPWQDFSYLGQPVKPEIIVTTSDIYDEGPEINLSLNFSDIELVDDEENPLPRNSCWKTSTEENANCNQYFQVPQPDECSFVSHCLPQLYDKQLRLYLTGFRSACIILRHLVSVDISPEGAIYVNDIPGQSITVVNDSGDRACIVHPNSRVLQEGNNVHIMTHLSHVVKICNRGNIFRASPGGIVYLVDESGTKSTSGKFLDLCEDFTSDVFYGHMANDYHLRSADSVNMLSETTYHQRKNGDDVWWVGDTQIKQDQYGNIEVTRDAGKVVVNLMPAAGEVSLRTSFFKATVGCFPKRYLSVDKGDCHVSSGFCGLTVQRGTQKAGLDRNGKVVIF